MIKLKELINDTCCDNCSEGKVCCSVNEEVKHIPKANKKLQKLIKDESSFRLHMNQLALIMSKDIVNNNLADNLIKSYKRTVTDFMRDAVRLVKKMK